MSLNLLPCPIVSHRNFDFEVERTPEDEIASNIKRETSSWTLGFLSFRNRNWKTVNDRIIGSILAKRNCFLSLKMMYRSPARYALCRFSNHQFHEPTYSACHFYPSKLSDILAYSGCSSTTFHNSASWIMGIARHINDFALLRVEEDGDNSNDGFRLSNS